MFPSRAPLHQEQSQEDGNHPSANNIQDVNDLFQALRNQKQKQLEQQRSVIADSRSIADTLFSKRKMQDETKSVVSAAASYANNTHYISINSAKDPRIQLSKNMHPLNPEPDPLPTPGADECDVYTSLVDSCEGSVIRAMPNHHITEDGDIQGFRFTCNIDSRAIAVPIGRRLFQRHSMIECVDSTAMGKTPNHENERALQLLMQRAQLKDKLVKIVQKIHKDSQGKEVSFDCMPDYSDTVEEDDDMDRVQNGGLNSYYVKKSADCNPWRVEMPHMIGVFHAYVKSFNKDSRNHKLFLAVSGGCNSICDQYFNLFMDVRNDMSIREVVDSDETWFLRKVNQRANARILFTVAKELDLQIPFVTDTCAAKGDQSEMADVTTETILYDIVKQKYNRISYFSQCTNTLTCRNGILCQMNPSEGMWLFKGPLATNTSMMHYGGSFGVDELHTAFPVCMGMEGTRYTWSSRSVPGSNVCQGKACFVKSTDGPAIARLDNHANLIEMPTTTKYTYIDESYTKMLQDDCLWNRDNGIVELMPLAVVVTDQ